MQKVFFFFIWRKAAFKAADRQWRVTQYFITIRHTWNQPDKFDSCALECDMFSACYKILGREETIVALHIQPFVCFSREKETACPAGWNWWMELRNINLDLALVLVAWYLRNYKHLEKTYAVHPSKSACSSSELIYIHRMILSGKDSSHVLNIWIKSQTLRSKKGGNRSEIRSKYILLFG